MNIMEFYVVRYTISQKEARMDCPHCGRWFDARAKGNQGPKKKLDLDKFLFPYRCTRKHRDKKCLDCGMTRREEIHLRAVGCDALKRDVTSPSCGKCGSTRSAYAYEPAKENA